MPEPSSPASPGRPRGAWGDVRELVWTHRRRLLLGFALLGVSRVAALVLPASSKFVVDEVLNKHRSELLAPLALAIGAATLVQAATSLGLARVLGVTAQRAIMDIRRHLQAQVCRLPIRFFESNKSGALISRIMTDPDALRNLVGTGLVQFAGSVLTAALALAVLLVVNWRLTVVTVILLAAFALLMLRALEWVRPLYLQRAELNAQVLGRLNESLGGIRVVKAYRGERHEQRLFTQAIHRVFRNVAREITASAGIGAMAMLIFGVLSALLVFFGGHSILSGTMTLGDFVMYVFFIGILVAPVSRIVETGTQLNEALAGLQRIRELRQMVTEDQEDAGREPLGEIRGEIAFEDVAFEYTPGTPVLKGVSFRAPAGTTTALVGASGAGKSTIINLVMGFETPLDGCVRVDGRDLARVRRSDYRSHLGVVLQETFLFDGSIGENIAYARPGASPEQVRAAARVAHCDEFVTAMEKGYETLVGERGVRLSGGQRQRVAIARAVLADPRILILDEATSHLDSESEALIQDGLHALRRGRTTFVIAHRLSTVRSADQILVVEAGEVVERGTHEELVRRGGRYQRLYERQYRQESNRFANPGEGSSPEPALEAPLPAEPEHPAVLRDLRWGPSADDPP
jgi:ABC-type multidrug transport system fused ATPase/permease subunit